MTTQKSITRIYDINYKNYDLWFDEHKDLFDKEIEIIRGHLLDEGEFLEVGVGTGRFAQALGIQSGLDPSRKMLELASKRGIKVQLGVAESLPYKNSSYNQIFFITSLCFIGDIHKSLEEARRVLKLNGLITIAFVDKESELGKKYQRMNSVYYKDATFLTKKEIITLMDNNNFRLLNVSGVNFESEDDIEPLDFCVMSFNVN